MTLTQRKPIRRTSKKRARENRVRRKIFGGSLSAGVHCQARLLCCSGWAVDPHEIKTAARGGSRIDPANVVLVCRRCHDTITINTGWADRHGWTLPSTADDLDALRASLLRGSFSRCAVTCRIDHREVA